MASDVINAACFNNNLSPCFSTEARRSYTCRGLHLSLLHRRTQIKAFIFTTSQKQLTHWRALGFRHYVIQDITTWLCPLSLPNTSRRFSFPGVPLCCVAPRWVKKTRYNPGLRPCEPVSLFKTNPYQFSLLNTLLLKPELFTWGSHCKSREGGLLSPWDWELTWLELNYTV